MINLEHVASLKKDNSDISFEFDVPNVKEIPISKSYNEKIMELFVIHSKQKEGKWVGGRCPFGYMQDPNDKNHLVINEDESYIVRKIFSLAHSGMTYCQITDYLINNKNYFDINTLKIL